MRPHRWIIDLASRLVPKGIRQEWRAEWEGELHHRESVGVRWSGRSRGNRLDLMRQSLGAVWDALWLQSSGWHSARVFGRHWRLALAAVLSLSVALTAIMIGFSAYDALLLRPPGVNQPASLRLVHLRTPSQAFDAASYPEYVAYREETRAFEDIAAFPYSISSISFTAGDRESQVVSTEVSSNYFRVLGIVPRLGTVDLRRSSTNDERDIVLSSGFWRRLGTDRDIVGRAAQLNGQTVRIVGVAPESFTGMLWAFEPDIWMSFETAERVLGVSPTELTDRRQRWLHMVGRLRPDANNAQALSDLQLISARITADHPETDKGRQPVITPISVTPPGERSWTRLILGTLVVVVLLILLVACANVTNLLLGLASSRRHEMLVRAALGASRIQLVIPLVRESLWLGGVSGLLASGAGWLALRRLSTFRLSLGPLVPVPTLKVSPDVLVLSATLLMALAAGVIVGLGPAIRGAADGLSGALTREITIAEPRKSRLWNGLVVVQMTVATVVLIGVGVSIRSLLNLQRAPLGFSARNLVFTNVPDVTRLGYDPHTGPAFFQRVREHLLATRGIEAVTFADTAPLLGYGSNYVLADGESPGRDGHGAETPYRVVDEHYFSTLGIALLAGRTFEARDRPDQAEVVVVNVTLAHRHWPGHDPIGQRLRIENGHRSVTVIGVVPDGKYGDVAEAPLPFMYFATAQHYLPSPTLIARTDGPPDLVARSLSEMVGPNLPASPVPTLDDALRLSLLLPRLSMSVIASLGVLALALAALGLYSTIFYAVSQRQMEIGIRMSLGATAWRLFMMVLRQTGGIALAGLLGGLAIGLALLPVVSSIFYGIRPLEPTVLAGVVFVSVALALGTTFLAVRPWTRLTAIDLLRR